MLYNGPDERPSRPVLFEEDKVVYARLLQLRALYFQKSQSYQEAMLVMCETCDISEATFNRDHHGLIYVFGDLEAESREFEKQRIKEMALRSFRLAEEKQDSKGMTAALGILVKLGGFDRDERDGVPLELLNPGAYALVIDEAGQAALKALLGAGPVVDLSALMGDDAQEIDFEEMKPGEAAKE